MGKITIRTINKRIENTDIFVFGYNPNTKTFTYSRPFSQEEAETLAESTNNAIDTKYKGATGLRKGLTAKNGSLINMSTLKGIVANNVLMADSKGKRWFPTLEEGLALDNAGMFPKRVLIDFGIALYNEKNPDEEIAQAMMEVAKSRGYETPVLASFTSLGLSNGKSRYGVIPQLASENGLITGQEAAGVLKRFYKGNFSGVRRVDRSYGGYWNASWDDNLDSFYGSCRVGRFSAEGEEKKLREETLGVFKPINKSVDSIVDSVKTA